MSDFGTSGAGVSGEIEPRGELVNWISGDVHVSRLDCVVIVEIKVDMMLDQEKIFFALNLIQPKY